MNQRGARVAVWIIAVLVAAGAAYAVYSIRQQVAHERERASEIDRRAHDARLLVEQLRAAQQAYVAQGQGPDFWMARVTDTTGALASALGALEHDVASDRSARGRARILRRAGRLSTAGSAGTWLRPVQPAAHGLRRHLHRERRGHHRTARVDGAAECRGAERLAGPHSSTGSRRHVHRLRSGPGDPWCGSSAGTDPTPRNAAGHTRSAACPHGVRRVTGRSGHTEAGTRAADHCGVPYGRVHPSIRHRRLPRLRDRRPPKGTPPISARRPSSAPISRVCSTRRTCPRCSRAPRVCSRRQG